MYDSFSKNKKSSKEVLDFKLFQTYSFTIGHGLQHNILRTFIQFSFYYS